MTATAALLSAPRIVPAALRMTPSSLTGSIPASGGTVSRWAQKKSGEIAVDAPSAERVAAEAFRVTLPPFRPGEAPFEGPLDLLLHLVKEHEVDLFDIPIARITESYLATLEAMRERVREEEWPFPYLHDESQQAARDWAAQVTPHVYVLDGDLRVRYEGAPDGDYMDAAQNAAWVREALDDLLAGNQVGRSETAPVGCSIKWK